ncbi:MAG: peptidase, partial [Erythrobacter sp.]
GDIEPVYATIFGDEPAHNPAPAPMADIARAMETVAQRFPETVPTYVVVHDPMTKGQVVQIIAEHPRRLIYGEVYSFDGVGEYLGKVGTSDGEIGRQAAASTYNLHFGNYAGLPVEVAYIVFGIALCVITSTGITLWLRKRSRKGLPTERIAAVWTVTVWGIPLALLAMAWLRFVGGPDVPLVSAFWVLMLVGLLFSVAQPQRVWDEQFRKAFGIALLASAFTHAVWFYDAAKAVLLLDAVMIAFGVAAWRPQLSLRRSLMPSFSRPE